MASFLRPSEVRALQGANAELSPVLARPRRIVTLPSPGTRSPTRVRALTVLSLVALLLLVADVLLAALWLSLDRGHDARSPRVTGARSSASHGAHALVLSGHLVRAERHDAKSLGPRRRARAPRRAARGPRGLQRVSSAR